MKMFWYNFYYGHKALLVDWVLESHPFLFIIKEKIMSNYTSLLCRPQRLFPISSSLFVYSKEHNIILSLSNIFLKLSGIQWYRGHELLKKAFIYFKCSLTFQGWSVKRLLILWMSSGVLHQSHLYQNLKKYSKVNHLNYFILMNS